MAAAPSPGGSGQAEQQVDLELQQAQPVAEQQCQPREEAPKRKTAPRLFVLDNAKFFLTMLVVAEHTTMFFVSKRWFSSAFHPMTLTFLMPTYVFISGYTSATDLSNPKKVDGIIKVGAIYFMCQTLMLLLVRYGQPWFETTTYGLIFKESGSAVVEEKGACESCWKLQDYIMSIWALWYLLFLVVWRLVLPFWWRLRWPLLTSWVFGAVLPCFKLFRDMGSWHLPLDAIFAWFPLFVLGAVAKDRGWQLSEHPRSRLAGIAVLAALMWVPFVQSVPWGQPLSTWTPAALSPAAAGGLHAETWHYVGQMDAMNGLVGDGFAGRLAKSLVRMGAGLLQACCIWGVLHIAPRQEWPVITSFGTRSLANYVFHPLSGILMSYLGVFGASKAGPTPWWGEPVVFLLIIPTSLFWMSPWVWKVARPILDPPIHWFLKPAGNSAAGKPHSCADQGKAPTSTNLVATIAERSIHQIRTLFRPRSSKLALPSSPSSLPSSCSTSASSCSASASS